jgi:hypothetical protein
MYSKKKKCLKFIKTFLIIAINRTILFSLLKEFNIIIVHFNAVQLIWSSVFNSVFEVRFVCD